jgi:hypothetical protein
MSRALIVSDEVYERLEISARHRGLRTVELLEVWQPDDVQLKAGGG